MHTLGYIWDPEEYVLLKCVKYIPKIPPSGPTIYYQWNPYIYTWNNIIYVLDGYRWNGCTIVSPGNKLPFSDNAYTIAKSLHEKYVYQLWYASLIHDTLYNILRICERRHITPPWTRQEADHIFYHLALESGVSATRARIYYEGLRIWTTTQPIIQSIFTH